LKYLYGGDSVNTDEVIRVSTEEGRSISRPLKAGTVRSTSLGRDLVKVSRPQGVDNNLRLEIPDLNLLICCSTKPVTVGRETQRVNNLTCIEGVKTLSLVEVPKHGSSIFSSGSAKRSIRGNTNSVKVTGVSNKVIAEFAVGQRPNLYQTVPTTRDDEGNLNGWRETNTGNPLSVTFPICSRIDGILALSKSIPKLNGLVTGSRDNLTVIYRESHGENIHFVTNETTGGLSTVDLP